MKTLYTNNEKLKYFLDKKIKLQKQLDRAVKRIEELEYLEKQGLGQEYSGQDWKESVTAQIKDIAQKKKKKKGAA